jgi:hypothetical protein
VKRTGETETETQEIEAAAEALSLNTAMKKLNKYLKLFKNSLAYVRPLTLMEGEAEKSGLQIEILAPHFYDVIENPKNPREPEVVILSNYVPNRTGLYSLNPATAGRTDTGTRLLAPLRGDGADQIIADEPTDKTKREYIWWSKHWHMTTNEKGAALGPIVPNPILELPFVNFALDQDQAYWATGGNDLADSSIKINALMTHINHASIQQGYGQLVMIGKDLPKSVKVGPSHCIQIAQEQGDPAPSVEYLSANPPVSELMGLVEMYVSLLLSTNNLSTSGFAANLKGSGQFASGIALLIDKSESIEDVEDQAQIFREREPMIWDKLSKWYEILSQQDSLSMALIETPIPKDPEVTVSFSAAQTILSETEKLDIIQKRRDLGLNTELELLMRDDPSLDEQSAQEKLDRIQEGKDAKMDAMVVPVPGQQAAPPGAGPAKPEDDEEEEFP